MNNHEKSLGILIIILFGLIPLLWFKKGLMIAGGDEWWLINPGNLVNQVTYTWNTVLVNYGGPSFSIPQAIPIVYFWVILTEIGFSTIFINKLWTILLFLLPGISMYFFMSVVCNKFEAKIVSSLLYMFNVYIIAVYPFQSNIKPVLIAIPLMLAILIKGLQNKEYVKYAILIGLSSLIYAGANVNPPMVAIIPFILLVYILWFITINPKNLSKTIKFILVAGVTYILLNLWWLIVLFTNISSVSEIQQSINLGFMSGGSMLESFRFLGMWSWKLGAYGTDYFPFWHSYYGLPLIFLSYLLTMIAILALILERKNKFVIFFGILTVISLYLSKGTGQPFGDFYELMYNNIPGFWIFREPYSKFTALTLFSVSVLLGISTSSICTLIQEKCNGNKQKILSCLFVSLIILSILAVAFPLITGEAIQSENGNGTMRSRYVEVPHYWYDLSDFLHSNDPTSRILLLPSGGYGVAYNWEHGLRGFSPAPIIFPNPTLIESNKLTVSNHVSNLLFEKIKNNDNSLKLMQLSNIRYILVQNDLLWQYTKDKLDPNRIEKNLLDMHGIVFVKSFGKLELYKIDDKNFLPHIYPTTQITIQTFDDFNSIVDFSEFKPKQQNIIVLSQNQNKIIYQIDSTTQPHVFFQKINPTKYKVKIENAREPFYLTFSESFHLSWKAYINTDTMECNPIATYENVNVTECQHESKFFEVKDLIRIFNESIVEEKHYLVNGYANAWYINPHELGTGENFTVTLYFKPQSYFYIGLIISGLTFIGCVGYLVWDWRKRRDKNINGLSIKKGG